MTPVDAGYPGFRDLLRSFGIKERRWGVSAAVVLPAAFALPAVVQYESGQEGRTGQVPQKGATSAEGCHHFTIT